MGSRVGIRATVGSWLRQLPAPPPEELRTVRPFLYVAVVVLCFLYGVTLYGSAEILQSWRLAPFTALFLAHGVLHWSSVRFAARIRLSLVYFCVQSALVALIIAIGKDPALSLGLTAPLIGEAIAMLGGSIWRPVWLALLSLMAVLSQAWTAGWTQVPIWLLAAVPIGVFVIVYVSLFTRQLEARIQAQTLLRELEQAHRALSEYAARIEDLTLAAERQRMARELHDTLAQGLAGVVLQLEAAESHLQQGASARAAGILRQAQSCARQTLAQSRQAIDDLRTGEPGDLVGAMRAELECFRSATGIDCQLEVQGTLGECPDATRDHLVRILSEALGNVGRHARARQVTVTLGCAPSEVSLVVRDDGVGFDPSGSESDGRYGVLGMRERARLCGGRLQITSEPGRGCEVRAEVEPWRSES